MGKGIFGIKRNVTPFFVGSNGSDLVRGVYAFHLDIENGEILKKKFYKTSGGPVNFYKNERFMYVCYTNHSGKKTDGGLKQYATMDLQFGLTADVSNNGKTFVSSFVNYDRDHAYAVDYWNGEVCVLPIDKHKIVTVSQTVQHEGHGTIPKKQDEPHPSYVCDTPDHKYILVCDQGTDEIVVYDIGENAKLTKNNDLTVKCKDGAGVNKLVFNSAGTKAYVTYSYSSEVAEYDYKDGVFTLLDIYPTYPKEDYVGENELSDILLDEDNKLLYVTNKGHDSISVFRVDDEGKLTYVEFVDVDENPIAIITLKKQWLVVACQKGGTLESFSIQPERKRKGVLYETGFSYAVGEPTCMIEARDLILDENGRIK